MIKEAIDKIIKLKRPEIIHIDDESGSKRPFVINDNGYKEIHPLDYGLMLVSTLTGLVDLINSEKENNHISNEFSIIHVLNIDEVDVLTKKYDKRLSKTIQINTKAMISNDGFNFGTYIDVEDFRIRLSTYFANSADKDLLLESVSRIESSTIKVSEDDGVSQEVTQKAGIARKETAKLPKYVSLAPFMGFPEIEPLEQDYLFRIRNRGDDIQCTLFNTGSNLWRLEICQEIKKWLSEKLKGWDIIV